MRTGHNAIADKWIVFEGSRMSPTATPKYYGEFKERVLKGEEPICNNIELQMNRVDELIRNEGVYYSPDEVEGWVDFCEKELTLTDGSEFEMLDSFKLWGEDLYGWYYFEQRELPVPDVYGRIHYETKVYKRRLIHKQYLIVGRGAAKSLYDSFVQAYDLIIDPETTDQITTAPTMRQADEVLSPLRTAIARSRGPLFKFLTLGSLQNTTGKASDRQKLASTKEGIKFFLNNSLLEVRPMSIDKLQGLRCKTATVDEWLSGDIREDPIGAIEQGASKLDDYHIIASSSEGTVRNGAGDTVKIELSKILKGEYPAIHVSIWWYQLDDIKEVKDPSLWRKANPNLGKTVGYDVYQADVERMEAVPSVRNDILAKRFGIPTEGYTYFFTYEETKINPKTGSLKGVPCSLGIDLSQGDDFCAFTFLYPVSRGGFGIECVSFISQLSYDNLQGALRLKYDEFIEEGTLIVMDGAVLDMLDVYDEIDRYIDEKQIDVVCMGYDPYNAFAFVDRWIRDHGQFGVTKVPQGARTESVPLGELKKMSGERLLFFKQKIMSFCMGNAIVQEDTNGNRKLYKLRYDDKIDNVSALIDAYVAYKENREIFE